jgi:glycosyltransferase involved in cell wall biosynthesis
LQTPELTIIHINASYKPAYIYGGPTMSVSKLCESINELRIKNDLDIKLKVFTTTANGATELNVIKDKPNLVDGVEVTYFKRITKDHTHFSPGLLWGLRKEILKHDKEKNLIIHIHSWWNLVSIFSCLIAKCYNAPILLSPRGMLTAYTLTNRNNFAKKAIHQFIGKNLLSNCNVHVTSYQEKNDVADIVTPKSITIIPNLVNFSTKSLELKMSNFKQLKLIYLSRIEEKKGLELLFDSLKLLDFDWHLTIAGSGEDSYVEILKTRTVDLKIFQHISWVGQITNEQKFDLLAQFDLCVLTSYNENFANVIIESLSVGTAVLVSKDVGLSSYVSDKSFGYVCELDTNDIKNKLTDAFKKQNYLAEIRKNAPQQIEKDFDSKLLSKQYIDLYHQILAHK